MIAVFKTHTELIMPRRKSVYDILNEYINNTLHDDIEIQEIVLTEREAKELNSEMNMIPCKNSVISKFRGIKITVQKL